MLLQFLLSSVFVLSLLSDEYTHAYCFFDQDEHFPLPDVSTVSRVDTRTKLQVIRWLSICLQP